MIDDVDPKVFLEAFITEHTCERCGRSDFDVGILTVGFCCQEVKRNGYTLKHWRNWRACARCLAGPDSFAFAKWISPVIAGLVRDGGRGMADTLREILLVQPMAAPAPEMFYMDFIGPGGGAPGTAPVAGVGGNGGADVNYVPDTVRAVRHVMRGVGPLSPPKIVVIDSISSLGSQP